MNPDKKYLCIGENFGYDCDIGYCGSRKTLREWLMCLFPNQSEDFVLDYFRYDSNTAVVKYIFDNKGKRLEEIKKGA